MSVEPRAVVIGAGFGGIAAALRLRARGYHVTLLDKQTQLGGRAAVYRRGGYVFDAGPTVVTAHFLFDELFQLFGKRREDYITFVPVYPWYRIQFADGSRFDYGGTLEQTLAEIKRVSPGDEAGYLRLLEHTKKIFDVGFTQLGDVPFQTLASMLKCAPQLIRLGNWRTVYQMASKYIKSEKLRRVFSFQPLLVGGNPFHTTSIYSLIQYLEREWGVHFAMGGTGAIVNGLERLMREEGVEIRLNAEVEEICCTRATSVDPATQLGSFSSNTKSGHGDDKVPGAESKPHPYEIRIKGSDPIRLYWDKGWGREDLVVCNADAAAVHERLLSSRNRPSWPDKKIEKLAFSMGLFVLYFGTTKQYPDVAHHTIILGEKYKDLLHEMFELKQLEPSDFSVYLHRPTATDPSMAPAGCDAFYVLVPVPNLQGGQDWATIGDDYRDRVIGYLERTHLPGLRGCITEDFYVTPNYFRDELNSLHGAGFGIQPTFTQSAYWRFHNKSDDVAGLYFVGASTHPGAGMPGVLMSAKVLERVLPPAPNGRPPLGEGMKVEARTVAPHSTVEERVSHR
jgi:phytoene desaturase